MKYVIVITGASSGVGALTARRLAEAGHTVYATMRETGRRNAKQVEAARKFAAEKNVDLRIAELDVSSQESADRAVRQVLSEAGRLDVIIHNASHMVFGPAEAFIPEQLAELYDVNVLCTQRVNRAALPILRKQRGGLVVWVGSSSTRGGTPPYLAPYFAAKAGMDAIAVSYAGELARWHIEATIVVPGAFTSGTNHFANAGKPGDSSRVAEYASGPTAKLDEEIMQGFARTAVPGADVTEVADAIVKVVDTPFGKRPFRVHVDPANDGAEVVNGVAHRVRTELLRNMGLGDLLDPTAHPAEGARRHGPASLKNPECDIAALDEAAWPGYVPVGNAVTQLASAQGAKHAISTTTSHAKAQQARSLDFDEVIDLSVEKLSDGGRRITEGYGADIVIDAMGGEILREALGTLSTGGSLNIGLLRRPQDNHRRHGSYLEAR
jgi:NAD(P)-dependent dehydrogenase (short-subunit alcohol dehydrogenase family)